MKDVQQDPECHKVLKHVSDERRAAYKEQVKTEKFYAKSDKLTGTEEQWSDIQKTDFEKEEFEEKNARIYR